MGLLAVVVLEEETIKVYQSADEAKLKREVVRAKKSNYPYAVLASENDDTTVEK